MALGKRRFRPMNLGDILDEAFDIYKTRFALLAGIGAIIYVPINFLYGMSAADMMAQGSFWAIPQNRGGAGVEAMQSVSELGSLAALLVLIADPVITGAFTYAISQSYLGESTSIGKSYGFILRRIGAMLWTVLLFGLAVVGLTIGISLVAALISVGMGSAAPGSPFVWLVIFPFMIAAAAAIIYTIGRMSFAFAALVVEGQKGTAALKRSWELSAKHGWRVVGILLVTGIIVSIIDLIVTSSVSTLAIAMIKAGRVAAGEAIMGAAQAILGLFMAPVMSIVVVLMYYDLRIRKEGFDLQMLARDLAAGIRPGGAYEEAAPAPAVETRCAHCGFPIRDPAESVTCEACRAVLHRSCWAERGGCTTPGCAAAPSGGPQT